MSRERLSQRDGFAELSPEVGQLDLGAVEEAMEDDPDQTLALLGEMASATDVALRHQALRLARRLVIDLDRGGEDPRRGVRRLDAAPWTDPRDDLDLDRSLDQLIEWAGQPGDPTELTARRWETGQAEVCLLIDRSGSMTGRRLATAAVVAAGVLRRWPNACSVVAISDRAVVMRSQTEAGPVESVLDRILGLKGRGTTDLALGMRTALRQLEGANARRRLFLLSDCRWTAGVDPTALFDTLDVGILAPADDATDAIEMAARTNANVALIGSLSDAPAAFAQLDAMSSSSTMRPR